MPDEFMSTTLGDTLIGSQARAVLEYPKTVKKSIETAEVYKEMLKALHATMPRHNSVGGLDSNYMREYGLIKTRLRSPEMRELSKADQQTYVSRVWGILDDWRELLLDFMYNTDIMYPQKANRVRQVRMKDVQ